MRANKLFYVISIMAFIACSVAVANFFGITEQMSKMFYLPDGGTVLGAEVIRNIK
jgi:hypothetical protein